MMMQGVVIDEITVWRVTVNEGKLKVCILIWVVIYTHKRVSQEKKSRKNMRSSQ